METIESKNFTEYWSIFKRHWLYAVATFGTVVTFTYFYATTREPIYSAQGKLIFKSDQSSSLIKFDSNSEQQSNAEAPSDRSQATEAKVIISTPILQKAVKRINILNQQKVSLTLDDLQQGLETSNVDKTDILQVSYNNKDPKLAALVVNEVMKVYVENHLENSRAAATSAAKFISAQLPRVKASVYSADLSVRNFKEKHQITDMGRTQESIAGNLERVDTQIDTVEAQLASLNSRSTALQQKLGISSGQAISVNSLSKSPILQGVLDDLRQVQSKLVEARARFQETNPTVIQLKDKEAQLKRLIQQQYAEILQQRQQGGSYKVQVGQIQEDLTTDLIKLEVERVGLLSELKILSLQQAFYKNKAATLPRLEQQLREQQRELSAFQSTYEALLKSLQEVRVIENRTVGNVRIIENAVMPQQRVNANKTSAMMAGSLAGILLASGVVYLLDKLDKRIKTVDEAKELFEYTLLATIPDFSKIASAVNAYVTSNDRKLVQPAIAVSHPSISESYRLLHANLTFLKSERVLQTIVIASSVAKEGKSTTCANLATVMAHLGYRVLIVDADLYCPSQHLIWQIPNQAGLLNVLAARGDINSSDLIQRVTNNLHVLTAGVLNSTPVYIDARSMTALMEQFRPQYDYIIFDTPPIAATADAHILGRIADGVLLVTRPSIADAVSSKLAKESLDRCGHNILGIVVNAVRSENQPYRNNLANNESVYRANGLATSRSWLDRLKRFNR